MTTKTEKTEATTSKSAADLLIEMQLKAEQEKQTNPLAVESVELVDDKTEVRTDQGAKLVSVTKYANGTVLKNFA
jgi:hypothetical protein